MKKETETVALHQDLLRRIIDAAWDCVLVTTANLDHPGPEIVYANPAFTAMTGYELAELTGQSPRILQGPATDRKVLADMHQALARQSVFLGATVNYTKDGTPYEVEWSISPILDDHGAVEFYVSVQRQISKTPWVSLRSEALIEAAPVSLITADGNGRIQAINQMAEKLFGYERGQLLGKTIETLIPDDLRRKHKAQRRSYGRAPERRVMGSGRDLQGQRSDGSRFPIEVGLNPVQFGTNRLVVASITDITQRKSAEYELSRLAYHDRVTGLYSRNGFLRKLDSKLTADGDATRALHLAVINIVRFSDLNNALGHQAGDALLLEVAELLRSRLGEGEFAARLGADHFAVLIDDQARGFSDSTAVIHWMTAMLSGKKSYSEQGATLDFQIGFMRLVPGESNADFHLSRAALALQVARETRGITWALYSPAMETALSSRVRITNGLKEALEKDQFEIHYQPKVSFGDGRIVAAEVLLRWRHPKYGLQAPDDFIPIAERSQLIVPIGQRVLEKTCQQIVQWRQQGLVTVPIAINVSTIQLAQGDFVQILEQTLSAYGVSAADIAVEVTESAFEITAIELINQLYQLKRLGVHLCLDDFGTGYSSLSQLQDYPFDEIKIDKSFVSKVEKEAYSREIVRMVISIANTLGADAIAEGVETHGQQLALTQLGCKLGQGYLFARPTPADVFGGLLAKQGGGDQQGQFKETLLQRVYD